MLSIPVLMAIANSESPLGASLALRGVFAMRKSISIHQAHQVLISVDNGFGSEV